MEGKRLLPEKSEYKSARFWAVEGYPFSHVCVCKEKIHGTYYKDTNKMFLST